MNKRIFALLLSMLMMLIMSLPVCAANTKKAEKEPLVISNAAELLAFAEQCRLDTYSEDLSVTLTEDIDLTDVAFAPIPVFSGSFDGNGHRITGLRLTEDGSVQGLFRYLTESAAVSNLTVEAEITPQGSRGQVGGIAGSNSGTSIPYSGECIEIETEECISCIEKRHCLFVLCIIKKHLIGTWHPCQKIGETVGQDNKALLTERTQIMTQCQ